MDIRLVEEAKNVLTTGSNLWKVKGVNSWYPRRYLFEPDNQHITYEGSRKFPCIETMEVIDIRDIHDIRKGWRTDTFKKISRKIEKSQRKRPVREPLAKEECCFSIIYGKDHKSLDLACPDEFLCNTWVRGLCHWVAVQRNARRDQLLQQYPSLILIDLIRTYKWLKDHFRKADVDKSGALDFDECLRLLNQLNIEMDVFHARRIFNEANIVKNKRNGEDVIDEDELVVFHKLLRKRPMLEELFNRYTGGAPMMTPTQLLNFLKTEQHMEQITIEEVSDIIDQFEDQNRAEGFLSTDGFRKMLLSPPMEIFNRSYYSIYQEMTFPISYYYIASSHNTYLMADQLKGESSVEGYIRALKMGCRCVELDLWDGPDNEPIIYHGYTLTSKILLKDVLKDGIKPYAFESSEYPVILSLENHLSVDQQKVLAKYLTNILGGKYIFFLLTVLVVRLFKVITLDNVADMLYKKPVPDDLVNLPSPYDLKKKILIKGKKLPGHKKHHDEGSVSDSDDPEKDKETDSKRLKLAPELSNLVNLCQAVHFKNFNHSIHHGKCYEISSLSESKALSMAEAEPSAFIKCNQKQLVRIYPAGHRQGSSNYDPVPMWNAGCQIVALNYQTGGKSMTYNRARFRGNGACGYVLKPKYLNTGDFTVINPLTERRYRKAITIRVISGQYIPKPFQATSGEIIDPYVVIKIKGHPEDNKIVQTEYVNNNGFNPVWNETFKFELKFPELAFVRFVIRDHNSIGKDEKLGEYTIAFEHIQLGYRHIHIVDKHDNSLVPASIFVHVAID
uniref:Phosphoinositide phospholipase C n=1 Tax=Strigamia maritima TaxID=126957 RepID=T1JBA8_STRMM